MSGSALARARRMRRESGSWSWASNQRPQSGMWPGMVASRTSTPRPWAAKAEASTRASVVRPEPPCTPWMAITCMGGSFLPVTVRRASGAEALSPGPGHSERGGPRLARGGGARAQSFMFEGSGSAGSPSSSWPCSSQSMSWASAASRCRRPSSKSDTEKSMVEKPMSVVWATA